MYFLISYMIVNGGILYLAHKNNPTQPNTVQTIIVSLLGLPLFLIATLALLRGGK